MEERKKKTIRKKEEGKKVWGGGVGGRLVISHFVKESDPSRTH